MDPKELKYNEIKKEIANNAATSHRITGKSQYPHPREHDRNYTYNNLNSLKCIIVNNYTYNPFEAVRKMILSKYTKLHEYDHTVVLLGYNSGCDIQQYRNEYPNHKIVIYQLEQLYNNYSQWYDINSDNPHIIKRTIRIQNILKECDEIWDYDLDNIEFLKKEGFKNIKHVPMFYCNTLKRTNNIQNPKYDIIFFGSINDRRAKLLTILCEKYNRVCILSPNTDCIKYKNFNFGKYMLTPVFDDKLFNEYVFNSKIILNSHYYDSCLQEQVRLFELLINNKLIISEKSRRNYFGNLIEEFETSDEMMQKINYALENETWKNLNISKQYRNNTKRFKIGAIYNTFYGLDIIEQSINSIKNIVDYIVIVHQNIGFNGNDEPIINKKILNRLIKNNMVNDIIYYNNENISVQSGVLEKRNIGLEYCKNNNCDFIIPLDADELYNNEELLNEINNMYDENIDTLYSPIYAYYYDNKHYFLDTYYVASVYKVDERKFEIIKTSVLMDPVRKMKENNYKISTMPMHHFTFLKDSYVVKLNNRVGIINNNDIYIKMKDIHNHLMKWKEGNDALVLANDLINGGIILINTKLNITNLWN
ncbi:DUF3880 domain-containing protein [bacterium]|jgi:hypothetical protein|nr:DUF3880 domain-containing protein [bacterium]